MNFASMLSSFTLIPELFYPILATLIAATIGAVACAAVSKTAPKYYNVAKIVAGVLVFGGIIAIIVEMALYYVNVIVPMDYYTDVDTIAMAVAVVILTAVLVCAYIFFGKKRENDDHTRAIVYGAISIAMSFALSYAKFYELPQGGSLTFCSLLPLMIYCFIFGTRKGILVCVIYGILQAVQDPWIIHPLQFLLDYPLAFGMIGLSGILHEQGAFKKHQILAFLLGGVIAVLFRYASHVVSGIFAFASYAGEGYSAVAWGFVYNTFSLADMAVALAGGCFLFVSKSFVHTLELIPVKKGATDGATDSDDDEADERVKADENGKITAEQSEEDNQIDTQK